MFSKSGWILPRPDHGLMDVSLDVPSRLGKLSEVRKRNTIGQLRKDRKDKVKRVSLNDHQSDINFSIASAQFRIE